MDAYSALPLAPGMPEDSEKRCIREHVAQIPQEMSDHQDFKSQERLPQTNASFLAARLDPFGRRGH